MAGGNESSFTETFGGNFNPDGMETRDWNAWWSMYFKDFGKAKLFGKDVNDLNALLPIENNCFGNTIFLGKEVKESKPLKRLIHLGNWKFWGNDLKELNAEFPISFNQLEKVKLDGSLVRLLKAPEPIEDKGWVKVKLSGSSVNDSNAYIPMIPTFAKLNFGGRVIKEAKALVSICHKLSGNEKLSGNDVR